jgi:hypothetical protein
VIYASDPGAVGAVHQTFVLTDILATGTLQTGVIFELQWYPRNAAVELRCARPPSSAPPPQKTAIAGSRSSPSSSRPQWV